jgi:hypothetical protein
MDEREFNNRWGAPFSRSQYSLAVDEGFNYLAEAKHLTPNEYQAKNKGHEFYFIAISAFYAHDYQTATFLFDAALSEDLDRDRKSTGSPAYLFMTLDHQNPAQAAKPIVEQVVERLEMAIRSYESRKGSVVISLPEVRECFLRYLAEHHEARHRALTTTFISFLQEWADRLRILQLVSSEGSRESFYTHLFRGCLLFESLLKAEPNGTVCQTATLGTLLKDAPLLRRLQVPNLKQYEVTFDALIQSLTPKQCVRTAIECTWTARDRLGHHLTLDARPFDGEKYNLLANNIAASCLHAIACLYKPNASPKIPEP